MFKKCFYVVVALAVIAHGCVSHDGKPADMAPESYVPDLVEITRTDPSIKLDIKYATSNNFIGRKVYPEAKAFLLRPAAKALAEASAELKKHGYGMIVFDAYRPWHVTKIFWDLTPEDKKIFVAPPDKGSKHNRACAVDVSLYDLKTGKEVQMPSCFDEMNEKAYPDYEGGPAAPRKLRDLLRSVMESKGFTVYESEWWHFDYKGWEKEPVLDIPFKDIKTSSVNFTILLRKAA